tara:strand:- start:334 stop:975 length:642 start_codon:yes stop_codon:yes gene_type:complete
MPLDRFAGQKLDAAGFKKHFGLESVSEGDAYTKGSTTGTKQVGALGTYMTEDDYNRLKNDDLVKEAYAHLHGEEKMKKKFGKDGISINTLDALFDDLSADPTKEAPKPAAETVGNTYSDKTAKAKAGVAAFENTILPYQGDYIMGRKDTNPSEDFMNEYVLQLNEYRKPRDPNQIDGPVYNPQSEEAAVAGFGDEGLTAYDLDFDKDRDLYYS